MERKRWDAGRMRMGHSSSVMAEASHKAPFNPSVKLGNKPRETGVDIEKISSSVVSDEFFFFFFFKARNFLLQPKLLNQTLYFTETVSLKFRWWP